MDIESLEYFIAVSKYRNITKTAEVLHISQSALSRRIQSLEEELGVPLLVRGGHYIELTPAGERFLIDCDKIVGRKKRLMIDMERYKNQGSIRIGYAPGIYIQGLLRPVTKLRQAYPDVKLQFIGSTMNASVQDLLHGDLDVVYTTYGEIEDMPHIRSLTLVENDLSILVPRGHQLWKKNSLKCEDLKGENLCIEDAENSSSVTKSKVLEWLEENQVDSSSITFLNSSSEVMLFVASGKGLGITAIFMRGEATLSAEYVKNILLDAPHIRHGDLVLAYREDNEQAVDLIEKIEKIMA
jgi:DNA-binding transcriptional LysR family regulator